MNLQDFFLYRELETKRKIRGPDEMRTHDLTNTGRVMNGKISYLLVRLIFVYVLNAAKISNVWNVSRGDDGDVMKDGKFRNLEFDDMSRA